MPKEFLAERCLQPSEILIVRSPAPQLLLLVSLLTNDPPGLLPLAVLDAQSHEVPSFRHQGQMLASVGGRLFAERTISLIYHGKGDALISVSRQLQTSSSKSVTKL
jgi:hypothetical protein